jgi:hypothetical protein
LCCAIAIDSFVVGYVAEKRKKILEHHNYEEKRKKRSEISALQQTIC